MEKLLDYGSSSDSDDGSHGPAPSTVPPNKRANTAAERPAVLASSLPSAAHVLDPGLNAEGEALLGGAHQGRIRSFAHVEGNYATHVFITVGIPDKARQPLQSFLQQVKAEFPALEPIQHNGPPPTSTASHPVAVAGGSLAQPLYHISLSRTAPIRYHQIESLVSALKHQLRKLDTFCISIGGPEVLVNDEGTRTFLALSATAAPKSALQRATHPAATGPATGSPLLRAIDAASRAFQLHGLPRFYADPRPHISVAWLLGDCHQQLGAALAGRALQQAAEQLRLCRWQAQVDKVICKSGYKAFVVWQSRK